MKNLWVAGVMTLAVIGAPIEAAQADPLDEAVAAYEQDDYAAALGLWRPLAEQGNARAQASLGFMYANGNGVPLDQAEAARWYQRAAAQGDALAQGSLGFMYAHGEGVPRDLVRAHAWLSLAAAHSDGVLQGVFARDRDQMAARLDAAQLVQAQGQARELEAAIRAQQASQR